MDYRADTAVMGSDIHMGHFPFTYNTGEVIPTDLDYDFTLAANPYGQWPFDPMFNQEQYWSNASPVVLPSSTYPVPVAYNSVQQPSLRPSPVQFKATTATIPESTSTPALMIPRKRNQEISSPESANKRQQTQKPSTSRKISPPRSSASPCDSTTSFPSARPHYAVEKRYRSTLNERYATLARIVSQQETVDICRSEVADWEVPSKLEVPEPNGEKEPGKRQSKTTTLSVAIDTIDILDRCCARKARELQSLVNKLNGIVSSMPGDFNGFEGQ